MQEVKHCLKCKKDQPIGSFYHSIVRRTKEINISFYCKSCISSDAKIKRLRNAKEYTPQVIEDLPNEIWKDVVGFEGLYRISNMGRCLSLDRMIKGKMNGSTPFKGGIKTPAIDKGGYLRYCLTDSNGKKRHRLSHRLVALAFIPNPENKPQINHINGIKTDNVIENLEWCTAFENQQHAIKMGLCTNYYGDKNRRCTIPFELVKKLRLEKLTQKSYSETARKYSLSVSQVRLIQLELIRLKE